MRVNAQQVEQPAPMTHVAGDEVYQDADQAEAIKEQPAKRKAAAAARIMQACYRGMRARDEVQETNVDLHPVDKPLGGRRIVAYGEDEDVSIDLHEWRAMHKL